MWRLHASMKMSPVPPLPELASIQQEVLLLFFRIHRMFKSSEDTVGVENTTLQFASVWRTRLCDLQSHSTPTLRRRRGPAKLQIQLRNAVIEHLNSLREVFSKNLALSFFLPSIQVREETVKVLENIVKAQGKHEIQDEGTSGGKGMVERIDKLENDLPSLIQLAQRLNKEAEVWKVKVQILERNQKRKEDVEGFKERLDKVVTRFQNRLPIFVGFLGVLFTITFPCKMRKTFSFLIALSCMGIILEGGLAIFHFWAISKEDVMRLKDLYENINTKKKGGSQSQANTRLPSRGESPTGESALDNNVGLVSSDMENGENCHQFSTFWWYAWPYIIGTIVMLIYALAFVLIFGVFIYVEKCAKDPILPTSTPVSSDDMFFPIA